MTDRTPTCCELACYEDPGCTCDGCHPDPAPLDVERLARALRGRDFQEAWHFDGAEKAAAVIAREYAKEPQP